MNFPDVDFSDVDLSFLEEIQLDRFTFIDNDQWLDLVRSKYSINNERKLRFVEALFQKWRFHRVLKQPNCPIPMFPLTVFSVEYLNI